MISIATIPFARDGKTPPCKHGTTADYAPSCRINRMV